MSRNQMVPVHVEGSVTLVGTVVAVNVVPLAVGSTPS